MTYTPFKYNPWEMPVEERKAVFVPRAGVLDRLLAAIREQEGRGTVQHYLLLGPRGIGKTTLLLMLRDAVREAPELHAKWFCVQLREEEFYVYTLRDLFALTLEALAAEEDVPEAEKVRQTCEGEPDDQKSLAMALEGLRGICAHQGRRLLLLLDNFGRVFPKETPSRGPSWSFRKRLSTENWLMVIGASVQVFEDIASYDEAFFNFFCPMTLANLDDEGICALLRKRAERDDNQVFLKHFEQIRTKVRAITTLTGGNPRLILMLYDILTRNDLLPVVEALRETMDNLTPLLKDVLENLPRQQSKTLDALMRLGGTGAPTDVARLTRLPLNAVTTQLGRLKESRFVESEGEGKGSPAVYRVADHMFRTWYQMRYLRPARRRIELFVEFLSVWYSIEERRRLLEEAWGRFEAQARAGRSREATRTGLGIEYLAASPPDAQLRRAELEKVYYGYYWAGDMHEAARGFAELQPKTAYSAQHEAGGYAALAARVRKGGQLSEALSVCSEGLSKHPDSARLRLERGLCLGLSGRGGEALADFDKVVDLPDTRPEQLASAYFNRGVTKGMQGDMHGEIADYSAVIGLRGAPPEPVAMALFNRGLRKGAQGDTPGEIADYSAAIELVGAPPEQVAQALLNRGVCKGMQGDTEGEIADYTAVIELARAPRQHVAEALVNRGVTNGMAGRYAQALEDFDQAMGESSLPDDDRALLLYNRAKALHGLERLDEALQGLEQCAAMRRLPTQADAIAHIPVVLAQMGRMDEAAGRMAQLARVEFQGTPLSERLERRIMTIQSAAKTVSIAAAERLLSTLLANDPPEVRGRLEFLRPALELARTRDQKALAKLPREEQDAARRIAAALTTAPSKQTQSGEPTPPAKLPRLRG